MLPRGLLDLWVPLSTALPPSSSCSHDTAIDVVPQDWQVSNRENPKPASLQATALGLPLNRTSRSLFDRVREVRVQVAVISVGID